MAGPARERLHRNDTRGTLGGRDLFLLADGRFLALAYAGDWSAWENERDSWYSRATVFTAAEVVAATWTPEAATLLKYLATALRQQAEGMAPERAKAARERAAKLRALAELSK